MTIYRIAAADRADTEAYWISARSEIEARRLVALNARNAKHARGKGFTCDVDASQVAPAGTIIRRNNGPILVDKR